MKSLNEMFQKAKELKLVYQNTKSFKSIIENSKAEGDPNNIVVAVIGITVVLIILSYLFAPVGLVGYQSVNRTAAGIASGTTGGNIWDAIFFVTLASVIIMLVGFAYKSYKS